MPDASIQPRLLSAARVLATLLVTVVSVATLINDAQATDLVYAKGTGQCTVPAPPPGVAPYPTQECGDIVLRNVETGAERTLVSHMYFGPYGTGYAPKPALSPDGTTVMWAGAAEPANTQCQWTKPIVMVDVASGNTTFRDSDYFSDADWSPDGRKFVEAYAHPCSALTSGGYDPGGVTGVAQVTSDHSLNAWEQLGLRASQFAYSPDGSQIAYHNESDSSSRIWVENPAGNGSNAHALYASIRGVDAAAEPSYSPDGSRIAFVGKAGKNPKYSIWVINDDGSGAQQITSPTTNRIENVSWSPDGLGLVYDSGVGTSNDMYPRQLRMVNPEGTNDHVLVADAGGAATNATFRQPSTVLSAGDLLAAKFAPKLFFDKGEKWRPLNIAQFFGEQDSSGGSLNQVCDPDGTCDPLTDGDAALWRHPSPDATIMVGNLHPADSTDRVTADDWHSPDASCVGPQPNSTVTVLDCNSGAASSVYYQATFRSAGYDYLDYWFFYRYNEFPTDDHQADWEGVTVGLTSPSASTFDWVNFAQHAYASDTYPTQCNTNQTEDPNSPDALCNPITGTYLRQALTCDAGPGPGSCGNQANEMSDPARGQRVWAFVAGGSHATYPVECDNYCIQPNDLPEGDHGGQVEWGNDYFPQLALDRFPDATNGDWVDPLTMHPSWVDWPGMWGAERRPASPANQRRFACPWEGNDMDATACSARASAVSISHTQAGRCESWLHAVVTAAACSPSELADAMRHATVGRRGDFSLRLDGRGSVNASGRGVAQSVGRPLTAGRHLRIRGIAPADTILVVHGVSGKKRVDAEFTHFGRRGAGRLVVRMDRSGRMWLVGLGGGKLSPRAVHVTRR